jgi:hypothetical protein
LLAILSFFFEHDSSLVGQSLILEQKYHEYLHTENR